MRVNKPTLPSFIYALGRKPLIDRQQVKSMKLGHATKITLSVYCLISGCSGGGDGNDGDPASEQISDQMSELSPFNIPGNERVASAETMDSAGNISSQIYLYDSNGRLVSRSQSTNGTLSATYVYTYGDDGKMLTRVTDQAAEDLKDSLRTDQYEGERYVGNFTAFIGEQVSSLVQNQYESNRITGYEFRQFDTPVENPALSDGALVSTGSYEYNESGFMTRWEDRGVNGDSGTTIVYVVDAAGRRVSHEVFDFDSNLVSTSTWVYEVAPCIEFPYGSITQWVCVQ